LAEEPVHAVEFQGRRYDAGDKVDFLKATVDFALRRQELRAPLADHMREVLSNLDR